MIVEVLVVQTPVRTQQIVNTSDQHIIDTVEVKKPTIQEKINQVTKNIRIPRVDDGADVVPRQILPMTQTVQKTIEDPQLQCIDEAIDDLVVQVPQMQVSEKTVDTRVTQMMPWIQTSQARRSPTTLMPESSSLQKKSSAELVVPSTMQTEAALPTS